MYVKAASAGAPGLTTACACELCGGESDHWPRLRWQPCNHTVCEGCVWFDLGARAAKRAVDDGQDSGGTPWVGRGPPDPQLRCPECGGGAFTDAGAAPALAAAAGAPRGVELKKAAARQQWLDLPAGPDRGGGGGGAKGSAKAQLRSAKELAGWNLGSWRGARTTVLLTAAAVGDHRRIACCFAAGCDLDAQNEYGLAALALAAWRGQAAAVALLLELGADPNSRANDGCTAAETASAAGHQAVAETLRRSSADQAGAVEPAQESLLVPRPWLPAGQRGLLPPPHLLRLPPSPEVSSPSAPNPLVRIGGDRPKECSGARADRAGQRSYGWPRQLGD